MKLLLIDTCGQDGSLALADTDARPKIVAQLTFEGRSASERLLPELRGALACLHWRLRDLAAIGVVSGPGSFTGVRIGLTTAKALCEAAALPLITVSRLAVLAHKADSPSRTVHALLDAGRGELFYGRFDPGGAPVEALLAKQSALAAISNGIVAVCEASAALDVAELDPLVLSPLLAGDALPPALSHIAAGSYADIASVDANYLRRTDLEMLEKLSHAGRRP